MTAELSVLLWSVVLLLLIIGIQATASLVSTGLPYAIGNQDVPAQGTPSMLSQRMRRILANFLQTYPVFIALAGLIAITQSSTETTVLGATIWIWARVAYIPAVLSGLPVIRSLVWAVSIIGLLMMLLPLL